MKRISRRHAITAGVAALAIPAAAAENSSAEKANLKIVSDFCAAWPNHNLDQLMAFFADNAAYRVTETMEPNLGKAAVTEAIMRFLNNVDHFEVRESWARGPMVFNERVDHFRNFQLKSWHGVGVFFLKDGKIVEWYDYTIATERA